MVCLITAILVTKSFLALAERYPDMIRRATKFRNRVSGGQPCESGETCNPGCVTDECCPLPWEEG